MNNPNVINYTIPTSKSFDFERFLKNALQSSEDSVEFFKKHTLETDSSLDNLYEEFHICEQLEIRSESLDIIDKSTNFQNINSLLNEIDYIISTVDERLSNIKTFSKEIKEKLGKEEKYSKFISCMEHRIDINEKDLLVIQEIATNLKTKLNNILQQQQLQQQTNNLSLSKFSPKTIILLAITLLVFSYLLYNKFQLKPEIPIKEKQFPKPHIGNELL